jgi:hypothetical protein
MGPNLLRGKGEAFHRAGKEPMARKREKRRFLECIFERMVFFGVFFFFF